MSLDKKPDINILLRPQGAKKWQAVQDMWTPRNEKRKNFTQTGIGAKLGEEKKEETQKALRYILPNWFCVDCGEVVVPTNNQAQNLHIVSEVDPALDLVPGNTIICYICEPCADADFSNREKLYLPSKWRHRSTQSRRQHHIFDYLRARPPEERTRDKKLVGQHATVRDAPTTPGISVEYPDEL